MIEERILRLIDSAKPARAEAADDVELVEWLIGESGIAEPREELGQGNYRLVQPRMIVNHL
jgi:hypothetical protein